MSATTYGLLQAIAQADSQPLPFAAECEIRLLGVTWTASIDFDAARYDGLWAIDQMRVEIVPKGRENTDQWITIDETELSGDVYRDIESACMKELSSAGEEDWAYDAWKEQEA